ncbi:MAG: homoserine dehydrogenase [Bacteroidota bacterium]
MNISRIGLFGFGCVGQGLYDVLHKTKGIKAEIAKICVKNPNKERSIPQHFFTYDKDEILNDPDIDVIVELIDDADAALDIVSTALKNCKAVVSANKKMIAENMEYLFNLQQECGKPLLYEGAVCGSIPIIRNIEEYYDNEFVDSVEGIFNGSTNYILTKIFDENKSFEDALKEAQDNGFAESDPTLDIGGFDPKFKLSILLTHTYGVFVNPKDVLNFGIDHISDFDIQYAREKGYRIKLLAKSKKVGNEVFAIVAPQFVDKSSPLRNIENEYNAVIVKGLFSEYQIFVGKGAGSLPTGSAVLSDISTLIHDYKYEYKKFMQSLELEYSQEALLEVYVSFKNKDLINQEDFESINESFISNGNNYIIGQIRFEKLRESNWLRHEDVNVILTPDSDFQKSPLPQKEAVFQN